MTNGKASRTIRTTKEDETADGTKHMKKKKEAGSNRDRNDRKGSNINGKPLSIIGQVIGSGNGLRERTGHGQ
jgi:hypothetical protein